MANRHPVLGAHRPWRHALRRRLANLLALFIVVTSCVACTAAVSYWVVVIDRAATLTVKGLCGATIPEVGAARITNSFMIEESDYSGRRLPSLRRMSNQRSFSSQRTSTT